MKTTFRVVSLFSGCGGLDLGFVREGFDIIWANDILKDACTTYRKNIGDHILNEDILKINLSEIPDADLVIGGPPCQGFSGIGRRDVSDERNALVWNFFDVIDSVKPNVFIFENVIGLKSAKLPELDDDGRAKMDENGKPKKSKEKVIDSLTKKFRELGYENIEVWILNAADYGVPQRRKRVFIVGNKLGIKFGIPPETHSENGSESTIKWVSSFDAISDLGSPTEDGAVAYEKDPDCVYQRMMRNGMMKTTLHITPYASPSEKTIIPYVGRVREDLPNPKFNYMDVPDEASTKRIMGFKKSGGRTTTYGRLQREKPTYTLNTHFNRINIGTNIHYDENRIITIREGLRFQSFPDNFEIASSTKRNYYLQVGNAVPPLLAQVIASAIKSKLRD
jgi:DNA (cytosine-5)-methyltransferase 1